MVHEVIRQGRKQFGVDGRIAGTNVVNGVDDAAREEVAPHAVNDGFGKCGVRG